MKNNLLKKDSWKEYKLKELGYLYGGLTGKNKDDFGEGEKFIPYMNVFSNSRIDIGNMALVKMNGKEKQNKAVYGDIFFTGSSETPEEVGMSSVLLDNFEGNIFLNSFCFGLRLNNFDVLMSEFAVFLFRSPALRKKISLLAQGSTRFNLSKKYFSDITLKLPSLTEQKKIAGILSKVDDSIEKTDEVIKKMEELKRGLMQELFTKGIGHKKFKKTKLGMIPEEWEIVNFSEVCNLVKEKIDPKTNGEKRYIGLEHIGQDSGNILRFGKSNETLSIKTIFRSGDILFGKLRPYLKKYWLADFNGVCSTEILVFRAKNDIEPRFIFFIAQAEDFINHSISKSFGTKMPRTDWKTIKKYTLALPAKDEQIRIADILSKIDGKIDSYKKIKSKLNICKKGLMQDLLSADKI